MPHLASMAAVSPLDFDMPAIAVFVNPHASKNRQAPAGYRRMLQSIVGSEGLVTETTSLDELARAVDDAVDDDAKYYVADGGDGSFHCVLNDIRRAIGEWGCDPDDLPQITPTRSGAIDFVARKVGVEGNIETILRGLAASVREQREPPVAKIESLRIAGVQRTESGEKHEFERLGFALAAGGVGQRFFAKYMAERSGPAAIVKVVAKALASRGLQHLPWRAPHWLDYAGDVFRPTRARVEVDGRPVPTELHGAIHAGAFDVSLGGVFRVFPLAREPGRLHFQAGKITPREMILALPRLVSGRTLDCLDLMEVGGRQMIVEALDDDLLEPIVDGECIRRVTRLEITPGPPVPVPIVT